MTTLNGTTLQMDADVSLIHKSSTKPDPAPSSSEASRKALLQKFRVRTLQEIITADYPERTPIVENFLSPGETGLLIARQKEGKSTLALQLAIDISRGEPFLGRYATRQSLVLYTDYENRPYRLRERGLDVAQGRPVNDVVYIAFDRISDRNVALIGEDFDHLQDIVSELQPGLLVLDPLRYAVLADSSDERAIVDALDQVSRLGDRNPGLAVLLVHHLKKAQDNMAPELRNDPKAWIDRVYGSQALIAHVETIWGLEHDDAGYALGTVSRSEESFVLGLEKEPESQRFILSPTSVQVTRMTQALRSAWDKLPSEFSRGQALALGIPNNNLDRMIRHARATGILEQDPRTKTYRKRDEGQKVGIVGI
jgi:AAA domain